MKVVIEIDELFVGVLSVTAVATSGTQTRVALNGINLKEHNHATLGSDGKWTNERRSDEKPD
jgi:hypothetical protein